MTDIYDMQRAYIEGYDAEHHANEEATIPTLHEAGIRAVAAAARKEVVDELCEHFNRVHRERWSPQIVDEIRALSTGSANV